MGQSPSYSFEGAPKDAPPTFHCPPKLLTFTTDINRTAPEFSEFLMQPTRPNILMPAGAILSGASEDRIVGGTPVFRIPSKRIRIILSLTCGVRNSTAENS